MSHSSLLSPPVNNKAGDRQRWGSLFGSAPSLAIASTAHQSGQLTVLVCNDTASALRFEQELSFYGSDLEVAHFPDWETLPYDLFSPHQDIVSSRIEVLHRLPRCERGVLVTPINTLMQRLAPPAHLQGNTFLLSVGDRFAMERTREQLVACGYRQRDNVLEHGEFAVRGAIMDIFPMGAEQPFRIELFDDEIESLRLFDAETQRSTGQVPSITLLPAAA